HADRRVVAGGVARLDAFWRHSLAETRGRAGTHGQHAQARRTAALDRAFAFDAPGMITLEPLLDDARRRVLDDQLFASQSVVRLTIQVQQRRVPPGYGVTGHADSRGAGQVRNGAGGVSIGTERVLTRTDAGEWNRRFAIEHAVLAKRWTAGCDAGFTASFDRGIDRRVEWARPTLVRPIAHRGHHEQIAGTGRGDVGDPYPFCFVARDLLGLVIAQIRRHPAREAD